MKRFKRKYLYLFLTVLSSILVFVANSFEFFSNVYYAPLFYGKEFFLILALFFSWIFWKNQFGKKNYSIAFYLKNFAAIILLIYILVAFQKYFFPDDLFSTFSPHSPLNISGLIISSLFGFTVLFLLPLLIIISQKLFSYRRGKFTPVMFLTFVVLCLVYALIVSIFQNPLAAKLQNEPLYISILKYGIIGFAFLMSFRHKWITYLPKSQKYLYAVFSLIVGVLIIIGFTVAFELIKTAVSSYSTFLVNFANHIWIFIIIYSFNSIVFLWLQLPTAGAFEKKMRALEKIHLSSQKLNELTYSGTSEIYSEILRNALELIDGTEAWIEVFNNKSVSETIFTEGASKDTLTDFLKYSRHPKISRAILSDQKALLIPDVKSNTVYGSYFNWKNSVRCLIATPLFTSDKRILGILYLIHSKPFIWDFSDLNLLENYSFQASLFLENTRLMEQTLRQERMREELRIARDVQMKLLPSHIPEFKGVEIAAESLAAFEVGGDFYDYITYADGSSGFVLGDVSGKGTQAAFYMAEFKGIIQSLASTCQSPKELAERSNGILFPNIERRSFITAIFARLSPDQKKIELIRAGHTAPLVYNSAQHTYYEINAGGIGLALDKGPLFNSSLKLETIPMNPGDIMLFYTDGLSELRNNENEEIEFNRIIRVLEDYHHVSVAELKKALMNTVFSFLNHSQLFDDLTFILLKFK